MIPTSPAAPGPLRVDDLRNAVGVFRRRVARNPEAPAMRTFPEGRVISWQEWEAHSEAFALRLGVEGVAPGDRIAIWADSRPLWPIADLGAMIAGAVPVGLYPSSAPAQVRALLADAEVVLAVVDHSDRGAVLRSIAPELPRLRHILEEREVDPGGPAASEAGVRPTVRDTGPGDDAALDDDALLIYTSGSTGEPKGARLSHRYLLASAESSREALGLCEGDVTLSFLPYCHAAERVFGLHTRILTGMEAVLVEDHRRIWEAARAVDPTVFGGLPRFYEKAAEGIRKSAATGGRPAELVSRYFGRRLRIATSGGATLSPSISEELSRLGVDVLGAYGLTEHLCATMNRPERMNLASAGPPMPGTEIRIADDGEILLRRGALTFSGYMNRPDATERAFTSDGNWLCTGDLGHLDAEGFLHVTGRKKELLALSTGKKVAPIPMETRLARDPWIDQAVLVGEGRKFVAALLVLRRAEVERWAADEGIVGDWEVLLAHPRVRERVDALVADANREVSRTEQVRRYQLLGTEFTQEAGELTPTHKVRRHVVTERYRQLIEAMYGPSQEGSSEASSASDSGRRSPSEEAS